MINNASISKSKECGAGSPGVPSIPPKPPVPRPRSQTMANDRKSQNYCMSPINRNNYLYITYNILLHVMYVCSQLILHCV